MDRDLVMDFVLLAVGFLLGLATTDFLPLAIP